MWPVEQLPIFLGIFNFVFVFIDIVPLASLFFLFRSIFFDLLEFFFLVLFSSSVCKLCRALFPWFHSMHSKRLTWKSRQLKYRVILYCYLNKMRGLWKCTGDLKARGHIKGQRFMKICLVHSTLSQFVSIQWMVAHMPALP